MSPPAVTLTFDLLTPKSNQHIYEPKYTRDQNWMEFPSFEIRYSEGFRNAQTQKLTHGRTHSKTECLREAAAPKDFGGGGVKIVTSYYEIF